MRYTFKASKQSSKLLRGLSEEKLTELLLNGDYKGDRIDFRSDLTGYAQFSPEQNHAIKQLASSMGLHVSEFLCCALEYYAKGSQKHRRLTESWFQYRLHCQLGGVREIPIDGIGRLDLLTHNRVIELKNAIGFKHALGQCLAYHYYYPNHIPTLGLIGTLDNRFEVEKVCKKYGVDVIWLSAHNGELVVEANCIL